MLGMFKALLTADSPLDSIEFDQIAKDTNFIKRKSAKFSAFGIVVALLKCAISGKGSFNQIASHLKRIEKKACSRQAIFQRINESCVRYLRRIVRSIISSQATAASNICKKWGFKRLLTEDSTFQKMHSHNAANFPAHGNKQGATSGFKIDFIYDMITGKALSQKLAGGTVQDKILGLRILDFVRKGDLILRDMGYFSIEVFEAIRSKYGHWLSRLPANVNVTTMDDIPIEKLLRSRKHNRLDIKVKVGNAEHKCRMVAVRADAALAAQRRRQRKSETKGTPSSQALVRDGWHILLTSLDEDHAMADLFEIYRLRWNIEVRFKAWKQALNMRDLFKRYSNSYHQESLIYAALIFQLITLNVAANLKLGGRVLSLENFSVEITTAINTITREAKNLVCSFDPRHILMERRKRISLMDQLVTI